MPTSNAYGNSILNYIFTGAAIFPAPTKLYVLLSKTPINVDGTGITEPVGNGYARVKVNCNSTMWTTSIAKEVSNKFAIFFPKATGNWNNYTGTASDVLYAALMTAPTGGSLVLSTQVAYKWIQTGTEYYIEAGNFRVPMV